ncbi:hypothetical protein U14_01217 [Candidatus Moduliflexus flocculans]|uniref:Metallo-beta-lactamase domain-containing protein n=1 Tax=Candidatus Moduliflexus flocculans TaxID=1499966 RepID=A0A0S6VRJ6_9BACT|nr:hypothetical protein U14_01217 [Candidatus Moduliflexus flocculans]
MSSTQFTPSREFELTILYDNMPKQPGFETAWGFACLIRGAEHAILFDTGGDGAVLLRNMQRANVDPNEFDILALSHQHWDHVGGLYHLLDARQRHLALYVPASFSTHFKQDVQRYDIELTNVCDPVRLAEGVMSTGDLSGAIREQALLLETTRGVVIVTGCAHPGILKIIETVRDLLPQKHILLVLGGFHLMNDTETDIERAVTRFRELGVEYVAPTHCSGEQTRAIFSHEYQAHFLAVGAGSVIRPNEL